MKQQLMSCVVAFAVVVAAALAQSTAPTDPGRDALEAKCLNWLAADDSDGLDPDLPAKHPEIFKLVIRKVLQANQHDHPYFVFRALHFVADRQQLEPSETREGFEMVQPYLFSDDDGVRHGATAAVGSMPGSFATSALVAMLYDPKWDVRTQAMFALARQAEPSDALLTLRLWHHQASAMDESRPPGEKWLFPTFEKNYQDALRQVEQRLAHPTTAPTR